MNRIRRVHSGGVRVGVQTPPPPPPLAPVSLSLSLSLSLVCLSERSVMYEDIPLPCVWEIDSTFFFRKKKRIKKAPPPLKRKILRTPLNRMINRVKTKYT